MPLGQFDERDPLFDQTVFDSTYTPGAFKAITSQYQQTSRWDAIVVLNSDTIAHNVAFGYRNDDTELFVVMEIPAGTGYGTIPPVEVLSYAFPTQQQFVMLYGNAQLWADVREAVTAGKQVNTFAKGGGF